VSAVSYSWGRHHNTMSGCLQSHPLGDGITTPCRGCPQSHPLGDGITTPYQGVRNHILLGTASRHHVRVSTLSSSWGRHHEHHVRVSAVSSSWRRHHEHHVGVSAVTSHSLWDSIMITMSGTVTIKSGAASIANTRSKYLGRSQPGNHEETDHHNIMHMYQGFCDSHNQVRGQNHKHVGVFETATTR
jgi:hypothetical protein